MTENITFPQLLWRVVIQSMKFNFPKMKHGIYPRVGGVSHVTITHDALDLIVQGLHNSIPPPHTHTGSWLPLVTSFVVSCENAHVVNQMLRQD